MAHLAVLTSGGDAPGMNAALRAVVRTALAHRYRVSGVRDGYTGLLRGDLRPLGPRDVGGIMQKGGTVLGTTRCESLKTAAGLNQALEVLRERAVDALIVIGGTGSQSGAAKLAQAGAPVIGIASTLDNDLYGSDVSVGATTAVEVALESIDRLRTTASSMNRAFLVEVMGRGCGYLALMAGIAGGAEAILVPEIDSNPEELARELRAAYARGKSHAIAVVAEGAGFNAEAIYRHFREHHEKIGFDLRVTTLGHVQRGGAPGCFDRILATNLGVAAVDAAAKGTFGVLVGLIDGRPGHTPLASVAGRARPADARLVEMARMLAA